MICDIGGGPGAYAVPLAAGGCTVHLFELVPRHIAQAQVRAATAGEAGERALPLADELTDAVLLGPLYHLQERADRVAVLREARRVGRPGSAGTPRCSTEWSASSSSTPRLRQW